jgi:uncharacterized protein
MPEPVPPERDLIRPLMGAATCAFFYWFAINLIIPIGRFLGGEMIAITVPPLVAAAVSSALAMAIFESRSFGDLGLSLDSGTGRNLLTGTLIGAAAAGLVVLLPAVTGFAHFEWTRDTDFSWRASLFLPVLLFCGAMGEEILFRGFALQYLMSGYKRALHGYGPWLAILANGVVFGLLHGGNPGANSLGILNTALFGVLFGAALLRTHDLWLPIGLHFGWNAVLPFLGVELSGLTIRVTGYKLVWNAGNLWSGGEYGPEGSILCSAALVLLAFVVWKVPVHRGEAWLLDHADEPLESSAL